jgi:hypothetical protein
VGQLVFNDGSFYKGDFVTNKIHGNGIFFEILILKAFIFGQMEESMKVNGKIIK